MKTKEHLKAGILYKVALSVAIAALLLAIGGWKTGLHMDEVYTFSLSNHTFDKSIVPALQYGTPYAGSALWNEYVTVAPGHSFDYKNVWVNQANDVHPPLYYALVHTVCSFFPGQLHFWMPLAINAALAVVVLWQIAWLFRFFTKHEAASIVFAVLYTFSLASIDNLLFFRMYLLLAAMTNALAIFFCKTKPTDDSKRQYVIFALLLLGGMLTQYYFGVFAVCSCGVYALYLIQAKNLKKIWRYAAAAIAAAVAAIAVFPYMINHIFFGYRGVQAVNLFSARDLLAKLKGFSGSLNSSVFGGLFLLLVVVTAAVAAVWAARGNRIKIKAEASIPYLLVGLPTVGCLLLIALLAPNAASRYVFHLAGLLYVLGFAPLIVLLQKYHNRAVYAAGALALLMGVLGYRGGIPNAYREVAAYVETAQERSSVPCLYVCEADAKWKVLHNYYELKEIDEIIFIDPNEPKALQLPQHQEYTQLLVYVATEQHAEDIIDTLLAQNSQLTTAQRLFQRSNPVTYYLQ